MSNKEIAGRIQLLGNLMELHGEPDFRTKSYAFAARNIKTLDKDLENMSEVEIENILGIGKAISSKINQLIQTGTFDALEKYLSKTPPGIIEIFQIKGIGPKKIKLLWDELGIESIGELLYACNENRLITIKGFGNKTQQNIKEQIEFIQKNANQFLWANLEIFANEILVEIRHRFPELNKIETVGDFANKKLTVEKIDVLIGTDDEKLIEKIQQLYEHLPIRFHQCREDDFYLKRIQFTTTISNFNYIKSHIKENKFDDEQTIYQSAGLPFIPTEFRDIENIQVCAKEGLLEKIIQLKDIKGIIHTHTKYSDGSNTIEEMANYCIQKGFEYLVISDHSKSAFYANGMSIEAILKQHQEIDRLNQKYKNFKIFKSIESDILYNGNLDYDDNILKLFDIIIASVHSNLKMTEEKAMERLIKSIENPYTKILGHLSGRLLLSRKAYLLDYLKIIDACAANDVVIELNANPHRLDIDYQWIEYCQQKNVKIAINPDAHHLEGILDIRYGVIAARKGLLLKESALNSMSLSEFEIFISH